MKAISRRDLDRYRIDPSRSSTGSSRATNSADRSRCSPSARGDPAGVHLRRLGRLAYDTILWGTIKKSGKTAINAALTLWWAFTQEAPNEVLVVANDLEQAQGRVYRTLDGLLTHNPELGHSADIQSKAIWLSNGTSIQAIASEYAGAAGSNHGWRSVG